MDTPRQRLMKLAFDKDASVLVISKNMSVSKFSEQLARVKRKAHNKIETLDGANFTFLEDLEGQWVSDSLRGMSFTHVFFDGISEIMQRSYNLEVVIAAFVANRHLDITICSLG